LAEKIEALKKKRGEYAANLTALEKSGERQISLTDPDSRAMAAYTKVGVGYNVQIAVDAKEQDDVEQAVTNDVLDMGRACSPDSGRRDDRCRGRQRLFQKRGHRGLREGGTDVKEKIEAMKAEIAAWGAVSRSTDFG
jgi:hypothetical protein